MTINGKTYTDLPTGITVAELLEHLGISEKGTAVAVNNQLVLKAQWQEKQLQSHDELTIISAAYGG